MSQPSPLESFATGRPRPAGEETGWDLLGYGWPALLILAGFVWSLYAVIGADSEAAMESYALSWAALADGRWWTPLSHIFVNDGLGGGLVVFALFLAAVTTAATANPGWMGGWRTPAVFLASAWTGAVAQILLAPAASLSGPWPAAAGLLAYWLLSGRLTSVVAKDGPAAGDQRPAGPDAASLAINWGSAWFLLLALAPSMGWIPSVLPGTGPLAIAVGAGVVVGGAVAVYALAKLGGGRGRKIAGLMVQIASGLTLLMGAYAFGGWLVSDTSAALGLPWASYLAGLAVGVTAGLVQRRTEST